MLLDLIVGYDCNLACDYCTISPAMRARALSAGRIAAALMEGRRDGFERLSITGGEPTIRPDLIGIIRRARELGFADIKLQTNGLLLGAGDNLNRLVEAGVTRFHVSIHTHEPAAYDAMVARAGAWPHMVAGLRALLERGLPTVADVILTCATLPRLDAAVRWLHGIGVRAIHLWFVSLTDHNRTNIASMPRMTEATPIMREAFAFGRAHAMDIRSLHVPRCLLGEDHGHAWDPAAEGVRVVSPDATFELRTSKLTGQRHVPACAGCAFEQSCPGLRDDYLARYGDAEIADARGHPRSRVGLPVI